MKRSIGDRKLKANVLQVSVFDFLQKTHGVFDDNSINPRSSAAFCFTIMICTCLWNEILQHQGLNDQRAGQCSYFTTILLNVGSVLSHDKEVRDKPVICPEGDPVKGKSIG